MKISIDSLSDVLSTVSGCIPNNTNHSILGNVLIEATADQSIYVTAFDLSKGIRAKVPASVEEAGSLTLPAKLLGDISNRLSSIGLTTNKLAATIASGSSSYSIQGMPAEEFPEIPAVSEDAALTAHIPADLLRSGFEKTVYCTSRDNTKQVLTGIHVTIKPTDESGLGDIEFVATDGHRLTVWAVEFDNNIARDNVEFTIPAGSVRLLLKCIALEGTGTDDCKIQLTESGLWISMNTFDVYTRLLEGQYPNYRQLIPVKFDHKITVGRKELVNALSRIAVVVEKNNNIVTLKVDSASQSVIATADVADVGSGQEVVAADCASSDLEFAMNLVYMMEAVKSFSSDNTVYICGNTRTAPFVIRGENTKNVAIVMPVQIRK